MTQTALFDLLERYRAAARTEREKGEYFENLVKAYLENDDVHKEFFSKVQTYAEWAERRGENRTDTGIDLVATRKDAPGYCAIQCKFYAKDYAIQKKDIDSFFTASGKESFTRRIIVCSSIAEWSPNAENALSNQSVQTSVIRISDMAQSRIDWTAYGAVGAVTMQGKKTLRPHQKTALQKVKEGFEKAERGKLIMACGTGKTFTSLRIAEDIAGKGGFVLYLVPSLSLMAQTVREWTNDADLPQASFAVCSDVHVGKRKSNDDSVEITVHDLEYPATTCADKLAQKTAAIEDGDKMRVIFATYHSIQVIADAQKLHGMADFNLVICDEAHRTTGVTLADEDESNFVRIHKQEHIRAHKRLYMTATPRLFADKVKKAAKDENVELCSMDDAQKFGETFHTVSFSYAVENGLLTDYRVIVLAVDEGVVSRSIQKRLTGENAELNLDDATKIIGCYRALAKLDIKPSPSGNHDPMRRAVAFCKSIKASKLIKREFSEVVNEYNDHIDESLRVHCEVDHVDGTFNATSRNALLQWLSDDAPNDVCRILSNAKCLSEGVDVPALDAILFLHPRKSQVDVVQSVGRVMRLAPGKEMGYVILPVGIPAGVTAEQALQSNEKYKVVWQILNALRAHDDRFNATINQADLKEDISDKIEVVAVAEHMPQRRGKQGGDIGGGMAPGDEDDRPSKPVQQKIEFTFDEFQQAIMAKIVKKCGTREYWEDWAKDIADIAQKHITRIHAAINADSNAKQDFERFLEEIRDDLNESVSESEAVEMLAQHMITKPVFEALFKDYSFSGHNPVSKAMQDIVAKLEAQRIDNENNTLKKFYDSVRRRVKDIKSDTAKQQLIVQLYDRFFKNAFPQMTQKLGIVYTPVEVVDFIIRSVEAVLKNTFGASLGSKGVHILDPFTGTGTFITRLLQSRIIPHDMLEYKYKNELHANEIVLLAYYIAAINIESAYHGLQGGDYAPFPGICLTDTFQLYEKDDLVSDIFEDNSQRRIRQKKLKDIRVIMGNPPYSVGQGSANDNAANVKYANLDGKIRDSYAKYSTATNKNALYDSYIRAIKWASDRIGDCGVVAYISGSAWIERNFADGLRKCLADEYSDLYIFHLRGDARKNMLSKGAAKEGGNIFGQNSMTGAAISVLVKNPDAKSHGNIHFCNIGEDLKTNEKLAKIVAYDSIEGITRKGDWQNIIPDAYNDWLGQRDSSFDEFIEMGNKKDKSAVTVFESYSNGVKTQRDAWCYNGSKNKLTDNIKNTISFYNDNLGHSPKYEDVKISWTRALFNDHNRNRQLSFTGKLQTSLYRPFFKEWFYFDKHLNEMIYQNQRIFPNSEITNKSICTTGIGGRSGFSALITDCIPCLDLIEKGQCFPLYLYDKAEAQKADLFSHNAKPSDETEGYTRRDGISDAGLAHFRAAYPGQEISKEDIFYYIYGLLHSKEYRARYADNLSKQLPRIPCVKKYEDFSAFCDAGRKLAALHLDYENIDPYPVTYKEVIPTTDPKKTFRVEKMKYAGKRPNIDKTTVIYNDYITMTGIPLEAYDYVVNGKPALDWVIDRQCVKTDKASGIVNDANDYANETIGDPAYPLKLFRRVITVSLETMKIVRNLPALDI